MFKFGSRIDFIYKKKKGVTALTLFCSKAYIVTFKLIFKYIVAFKLDKFKGKGIINN